MIDLSPAHIESYPYWNLNPLPVNVGKLAFLIESYPYWNLNTITIATRKTPVKIESYPYWNLNHNTLLGYKRKEDIESYPYWNLNAMLKLWQGNPKQYWILSILEFKYICFKVSSLIDANWILSILEFKWWICNFAKRGQPELNPIHIGI